MRTYYNAGIVEVRDHVVELLEDGTLKGKVIGLTRLYNCCNNVVMVAVNGELRVDKSLLFSNYLYYQSTISPWITENRLPGKGSAG